MPQNMRSFEFVLHPEINVEQITDLVTRIGELAGCRGCGLGGVDIRLVGADPTVIAAQGLAEIPMVQSVVISGP